MKYRVYEIGTNIGFSGMFCIDKKNNDLMESVYLAFEKNLFVDIHVMRKDGSKINENPIQVNPRFIGYIVEVDRDHYPVHLGGKR